MIPDARIIIEDKVQLKDISFTATGSDTLTVTTNNSGVVCAVELLIKET